MEDHIPWPTEGTCLSPLREEPFRGRYPGAVLSSAALSLYARRQLAEYQSPEPIVPFLLSLG